MTASKWCSADILVCLTPLLFLEFNIARLALGLCDGDELALDCMYALLRSLPGVQSVEPGLIDGAIFHVWKEAGSPSIIPLDLQPITNVTQVDPKPTPNLSLPPSLPLYKYTQVRALPKRQTTQPMDDATAKKYKRRSLPSRKAKTQTVAVAQKTKELKRRTPQTKTRPVTRSQSTATP